ncbi:MAG: amidase [Candidatus Competibacterales bacterium]
MYDTALPRLSAAELLVHYRRRTLSPVEVTDAVLAHIEALDPQVNAFCLVDIDGAKTQAKAAEARWFQGQPKGLVDGVPTTIKDVILTKGWPTRRGSPTVDPAGPWEEDAPAVARLREQGAVLVGKTTTPEFGWKAVTDSPLTGTTRNPWNVALTPGGSSGGAAVAAALGMGALHLGTDGGGSIRIPAAFTGVVGLKPSFGRVPAYPLSPFGTVAHLGPLTRTVEDAALMLTVMAQPDHRDGLALPFDGRDYRVGLARGVAGLRLAFSPDLGGHPVAAPVAQAVAQAVEVLADLGAQVERVAVDWGDVAEIFRYHWYAGAAAVVGPMNPLVRQQLDPGLQEVAALGATFGLMDYLKAVERRGALGLQIDRLLTRYDALLTPAVPIAAFAVDCEVPNATMTRWTDWTPFSYPFNLSQHPACSVPCGLTTAGLPVGLQIVGPRHDDALVLRAAQALAGAKPWSLPDAPRRMA